jgi:hypothetical protein
MANVSVKHSGHIGDILYSLNTVKSIADKHGPVDFYIGFSMPNQTPNHPSGKYTMTDKSFAYVLPLLESLPYINKVYKHNGQHIDFDLDKFRLQGFNLSALDLRKWYSYVYPDFEVNLSDKLIDSNKTYDYLKDAVVVNLTKRYRTTSIDYRLLAQLNRPIYFVGLDEEHVLFQLYEIEHKKIVVKDALHMSQILNSCYLFIGNQSSTFALAEQMKINRGLEVHNVCPNVIVSGANGIDYMTNDGLKSIIAKHIKNDTKNV